MPLIIITGLPTSGKSTRAAQLQSYLSQRIAEEKQVASAAAENKPPPPPSPPYRIHLISDQTLHISRSVYDLDTSALPAHTRSANASEKDARAALYGAVKRVLSPRDIVVLDGLNYIKGWRYQLYCEAKNLRTPHAVLQIGCTPERARRVNEERLRWREEARRRKQDENHAENDGQGNGEDHEDEREAPYEPSNWDNLIFRYEEPNAMTRWDSPLFTLIWKDDEAQTQQVFASIWDAVAGDTAKRAVIRPNQAAVQRGPDASGDYLYALDRETQDVVKRVFEGQEDGGGAVRIPRNGEDKDGDWLVVVLPSKRVGLPQLQRHRRAFVALNRGGIGLEAAAASSKNVVVPRLRENFAGYLNDIFDKDV